MLYHIMSYCKMSSRIVSHHVISYHVIVHGHGYVRIIQFGPIRSGLDMQSMDALLPGEDQERQREGAGDCGEHCIHHYR